MRKDYDDKLRELHVRLVELQDWVRHKGKRVCIVFEDWDGPGKGGAIKTITARVNPRVFRIIALPARTEPEKSQVHTPRYLSQLPSGERKVGQAPRLPLKVITEIHFWGPRLGGLTHDHGGRG